MVLSNIYIKGLKKKKIEERQGKKEGVKQGDDPRDGGSRNSASTEAFRS